jgi:isoleucyl-tRNA synthetase
VLSPVDDRGRLTAECAVPALEGMYVFDANPKVRDILRETGSLWSEESYAHDYPHCWRSKTPIVFRAVTQWFIRVDEFRARALEEIGKVQWIPSWGENRIRGAVETRPDWCISRQRTWGVPIPAFVDGEGRVHLQAEVVRKFADVVEKEGTDVWYAADDGELCRRLGLPGDWKKTHDTLDVWIDSGSSHEAVARRRLRFPADLYLEGSDQHRGWFQSSLLTSVAVNGCAPFRQVLTNGFVVDLDGKKLSKSNTYQKPTDLMSFVGQYGADILRLWVAHEDYRNDVPFSEEIFKRVADTYRTLRNTLRILLANVRDFDPAAHRVADADLTGLDRYVMRRLQDLVRRCREAYLAYEFHQVYHAVNRFCAVDLSALYIDVTKDRMYCDPAGGPRRRAVQTVMHEALETLVLLLAPILPFTAEEAWQYARDGKDGDAEGKLLRDSVHLQLFPGPREIPVEAAFEERWQRLLALRGEVNEVLEGLRKEKTIGKSLEAEVVLPAARAEGQTAELLAELFIVSSVRLDPDASGIAAGRAGGEKCVRCWRQVPDRGADPAHPELCGRCAEAVAGGAAA